MIDNIKIDGTYVYNGPEGDPRTGQKVTIHEPAGDDERAALNMWRMMFNDPEAEIGVFEDGTDFPMGPKILSEVSA